MKEGLEEPSGVAFWNVRHGVRGARSHQGAPVFSAFWAHVDEVVAHLQYIEVVFDDQNSVSLVHELVKHVDEKLNVLEMKARRGLVQNVECASRAYPGEFRRQFHPLCLATAERGALLS